MPHPLLSVIIPTAGRPQFLPRAIQSALHAAPKGSVEVIVVPNGKDKSWQTSVALFNKERNLYIYPIEKAHANVARNYGLYRARGKYVRFLDDDDFLYPDKAQIQLELLDTTLSEFCSARVIHVNSQYQSMGRVNFPDTTDFVCAALTLSGFHLPIGNVFLTSALPNAAWDESIPRAQDYVWMLQLARLREWKWVDYPEDVGAWFHHGGDRVSSTSARQELATWVISAIFELYDTLFRDSRLDLPRKRAVAEAIWSFAHIHFPRFPLYSHAIAKRAMLIDSNAKPPITFLQHPLGAHIPPLFLEWMMLPKRFSNHLMRLLGEYFGVAQDTIRKL